MSDKKTFVVDEELFEAIIYIIIYCNVNRFNNLEYDGELIEVFEQGNIKEHLFSIIRK